MTFQTHPQSVTVPFPYNGISTNADNDITYAAFIQNVVIGFNKTGKLRYGTSLVSSFMFNPDMIYRDIIEVMYFVKPDGTSEQLVYIPYLTEIGNYNQNDFTIVQSVTNPSSSTITIDISGYSNNLKMYLDKVIFDGVYVLFRQTRDQGADVTNYIRTDDAISFDMPYALDSFEDQYSFWIERAAIYKSLKDNTYQLVTNDLDPNVIVSSLNFQGKLLICNGIDPVKVYDGDAIVNLTGEASIPIEGGITVAGNTLQFNVFTSVLAEVQNNLSVGSPLRTFSDAETRSLVISNIVYGAAVADKTPITITVDNPPQVGTRKLFFDKQLPPFSYITIAHKRLWALPGGRPYKNRFRSPELSLLIYYAYKINSLNGWYHEQENILPTIDGRENADIPDNFETIVPFDGKLYFFGRESWQEYDGEDPGVVDDGQNLTLNDLKWSRTGKGGVIQRRMLFRGPNDIFMLSNSGIVRFNSMNITGEIISDDSFAQPINDYVNKQMASIETDRDYRSMSAFIYSHGRFGGFKIKYSCIIGQTISEKLAWLIFTENFASANAFSYDPITQDLYIGSEGGKLLRYADKPLTQSYIEEGKGTLPWVISYNWLYPGTTWVNSYIYFSGQTLKSTEMTVRVYTERDNSRSVSALIPLKEHGVLYDVSYYDMEVYSYKPIKFPRAWRKFCSECFKLDIRGQAQDLLIIDKLFLAGGTQDQNGGNNASN